MLLGIDVGTGGTRALLTDALGRIVASAVEEHVPFASPQTGWAEQEPADWWRAAQVAIRAVLSQQSSAATQIAAVGLTGQMHGAVLLDEADQPLRPSLIWCDQRSAAQCDWLNATAGPENIVEWTANPALPNFTLTKLLWVRKHEPETWRKFRRFLLPKDYLRLCLTGDHATDVADASGTLLLDVVHRRWSQTMLDAAGLDAKCLPSLYESPQITGVISATAAKLTGLRAGTPVVAGAGDQAAGATGMGILAPGDVSATIGTSGVVFAATDIPFVDPRGRLHTFCHASPNRWHVMGVTQAAGLSLRWFRDTFGAGSDSEQAYPALMAEAAAIPAGADGVLWAPYLMGERTPHLDPAARAALIGLAANHHRGHIIRAILEGVAFSLNDTLTIFRELRIPIGQIRLGGGGARGALWRQIQADVYGQPVETVQTEEGAAYGAALLAGVGAEFWPTIEDAAATVVHVADRIAPESSAVQILRKHYAAYRRLYPALRGIAG